MSDTRCGAKLTHTHGVALCELPVEHPGVHSGTCWSCLEDGDADDLEWTDLDEHWVS